MKKTKNTLFMILILDEEFISDFKIKANLAFIFILFSITPLNIQFLNFHIEVF